MKNLNIDIEGKTTDELLLQLAKIAQLMKQGFTSGYGWDIQAEEEGEGGEEQE